MDFSEKIPFPKDPFSEKFHKNPVEKIPRNDRCLAILSLFYSAHFDFLKNKNERTK